MINRLALLSAMVLVLLWAFASSVSAGCTSRVLGSRAVYECDDGLSGTARNSGGRTLYEFNNGLSGTARNSGGRTLYKFFNER